ncbi:MAG: hypothetical protein M2R45_02863 [Verrucomicrobia subdivision 3 bacterium]|nr:hypothetical protein [Limisphaerales bacterium]MCS1414715.1 hypothetical protein [Limisphaerales bacterium]
MMNALAVVWAEAKQPAATSAHRRRATWADYRLAARVFCVLAHPLQPPCLPSQVKHLAKTYAGISRDRQCCDKFRKSISIGLLATCKDVDAVLSELAKTGIGGLFRL